MLKLDSAKKFYPLWTTLIGLISYATAGFIVNLMNRNDEMLLLLCLCGAIALPFMLPY